MEEQKCRVCGCTDNDCSRCIKITGKPCHWVEPDLCSACADAINTSKNQSDMNFFQQLAAVGNVDLTLRILQKGDELTIDVRPGSMASTQKPYIVSGTAADMDAEFFQTVMPGAAEIKGIVSNLEQAKESAQNATPKREPAKKTPVKKTPAKKSAKPAPAKKAAVKKAAKPAAAKTAKPAPEQPAAENPQPGPQPLF
jgi:PRTRC genetic system protein E